MPTRKTPLIQTQRRPGALYCRPDREYKPLEQIFHCAHLCQGDICERTGRYCPPMRRYKQQNRPTEPRAQTLPRCTPPKPFETSHPLDRVSIPMCGSSSGTPRGRLLPGATYANEAHDLHMIRQARQI